MVTIRKKPALALVFLAVLFLAGPAAVDAGAGQPEPPPPPADDEQEERRRRGRRSNGGEIFRIGTPVQIDRDERVDGSVIVLGAPVRVLGVVTGEVLVIGGPLTINGEVRQNVATIGGPMRLGPQAVIGGDILTLGGPLRRARGATVEGDVADIPNFNIDLSGLQPDIWPFETSRSRMARTWDLAGTVVRIIFLALVAAIALLAMRGTVERVAERAASEPLKSGLVGFLAQMLIVPVSVLTVILLVISLIGIPLLLLAPFVILGLVCVSIIGFTGVALGVGHAARSRMGALGPATYTTVWAGIVLLVVPTILGETMEVAGGMFRMFGLMFLLIGVLVEYAAWTAGLGALILNGMGAPFSRQPAPAGPAAPPPVQPSSDPVVPPPPDSPASDAPAQPSEPPAGPDPKL